MSSDDLVLQRLAKDGQMSYAEWPSLLERLLLRLEHIAYKEFPMPRIPLPDFVPSSQKEELIPMKRESIAKEESSIPEQAALETSERDDIPITPPKEAPATPKPRRLSNSPSLNANTVAPPPNSLPPPLLSLLQTIQSTLSSSFPISPPHTAQRLAELLLHPKLHYRTLPSYLRALDRIVSVASPADIFPLPDLTVGNNIGGPTLNGIGSPPDDDEKTEDRDFIGGAELTEIPWLRNTSHTPPSSTPQPNTTTPPTSDLRTESTALIDGPNGAGSIETVTVNVNGVSPSSNHHPPSREEPSPGITQGELLRQEQTAGITPVPSPSTTTSANSRITRSNSAAAVAAANRAIGVEPSMGVGDGEAVLGGVEAEPEVVHARGPGLIGMEDMGPQAPGSGLAGGLDLEGALGRRGEGEIRDGNSVGAVRRGEGEEGNDGREKEGEGEKDRDGDVVIADADGVVEGEEGVNRSGGERG